MVLGNSTSVYYILLKLSVWWLQVTDGLGDLISTSSNTKTQVFVC